MGKLHTVGTATIRVYGRDHRPPHFHVVTPENEAMVDIATLTVIRGTLPGGLLRPVLAWARDNAAALAAEWTRLNPDLPV